MAGGGDVPEGGVGTDFGFVDGKGGGDGVRDGVGGAGEDALDAGGAEVEELEAGLGEAGKGLPGGGMEPGVGWDVSKVMKYGGCRRSLAVGD